MHVTQISHLYPGLKNPARGSFIEVQREGIAEKHRVRTIIPTVYPLPFTSKWSLAFDPLREKTGVERFYYVSFPRSLFFRIKVRGLARKMVRAVSRQKTDLIHINWLQPDGFALPALRALSVPILLHVHGSDWYKTMLNPKHHNCAEVGLFAADRIVVVGSQLKRDILEKFPALSGRISVLHNPVDTGYFCPGPARLQLKPEEGTRHLLCVANISKEKGVHVLLDAFHKRNMEGKWHLHLIGNVPVSSYSAAVVSRIRKSEFCTLHKPVPHADIREYYRAADLVVQPSLREGFGLALAEALCCGVPAVATKSGGPEDIMRPECGKMVEAGSVNELSAALDFMSRNLKDYKPETIAESTANRFAKEKIYAQLELEYQETIWEFQRRISRT
ncbi:MAG: glycosyltransferase [Balneolales bacterium]|nr:glycosyltransferase [Balneolales bacterium]